MSVRSVATNLSRSDSVALLKMLSSACLSIVAHLFALRLLADPICYFGSRATCSYHRLPSEYQ